MQAFISPEESQRFLQSTLNALTSHVAVLDQEGKIVAVNRTWQRFAAANQGTALSCGVGADYLAVCEQTAGANAEEGEAEEALSAAHVSLHGER